MGSYMLSIIVPIYNAEKYIEKCIESILDQTYKNYELILVDDGSEDRSSDICDEYATHSNVKVIHKSNGGLINARKTGVGSASGEYIGFVDSDDWIEPDMYEILMKRANIYSADIVSCGYYLDKRDSSYVVCDTDEIILIDGEKARKNFFGGILAKGFDWRVNRNITPSVCNKIFKKRLLEKAYEKIDERIVWDEDTITILSTVLESERIVLIPDVLYHYRQNMLSVSHKRNREVLQNYVYTFNELWRISKEYDGILDDQIPFFSFIASRVVLEVGFGIESGKQYLFPFDKVKQGSNVIIYGAGRVGRSYINELSKLKYASNIYITDSNSDAWSGDVMNPDEALKKNYDIILIAVENEETERKIRSLLIEKGVSEKKILWQKPIVLQDVYSFHR